MCSMVYKCNKFNEDDLKEYKNVFKHVSKHYIKSSDFKWTEIESFDEIKYDMIDWDLDHVRYFFLSIIFSFFQL